MYNIPLEIEMRGNYTHFHGCNYTHAKEKYCLHVIISKCMYLNCHSLYTNGCTLSYKCGGCRNFVTVYLRLILMLLKNTHVMEL